MPPAPAHRPGHRTSRRIAALTVAAAALTVPECASSTGRRPGGLTSTTVGALPIVDDVPVYLAGQQGYFRQQGLDVTIRTVAQSTLALPDLLRGLVDIITGAALVTLDEFRAAPNAARIQRMADHMQSAGLLNVAPLIVR
jgi:NitT/TauT family transport system substrate-binding protein